MLIDAHFHCWQLARGDYGWLTPALAPIYRDVAVRDWQSEASPLGVAGGVLGDLLGGAGGDEAPDPPDKGCRKGAIHGIRRQLLLTAHDERAVLGDVVEFSRNAREHPLQHCELPPARGGEGDAARGHLVEQRPDPVGDRTVRQQERAVHVDGDEADVGGGHPSIISARPAITGARRG